ncbi:MAG: pseudouridine synthase [Campylobacterales bacterium]
MAYEIKKFDINGEKLLYFMIEKLGITERAGKRLIDKGRVKLNGEVVAYKGVRAAGEVEVLFYEPTPSKQLIPVFEEDDFAVFEKPSFMLSHPNGFETQECLLDSIKKLYGYGANITHRLDYETSGLIVASKNKAAESILKTTFETRGMQKEYTALLFGHLSQNIEVECLLEQIKVLELKVMQGASEQGKHSLTLFEPLEYFKERDMTLVRAKPFTGRLHQIRLHAVHMGYPIVGEPIYRKDIDIARDYLDKKMSEPERIERTGAKRICLHASKISFEYKGKNFEIASSADIRSEFVASI